LLISAKRAEINLIFEDMPRLDYFENLNLNYEPEFFFQTLVSCIKNNVLSHQATIFKLRSEKKNRLAAVIMDLKNFFSQNTANILRKERQLSDLVESELRDELLHFKKFETLNSERITPYFMNLVKTTSGVGSISEIKKDDGTDFNDENELNQHIFDYYKDIYSQPNTQSKTTTLEDINDFLGPVKDHPIVQNAKLDNNERDELDSEITMQELTKSIGDANLSSAPGADGISNRFIKRFWDYFKKPLLNLCNSCYSNGELPMIFRTANIKLIPKKGELSKIKNWRPISLLNCFYKIISRVITARLRKYMDKMTPICQKGYSSTRYCQEVLISVVEGIEKCKVNKKKGVVISLDIKKAFDSLSHSFLQGVYDFFNLGPRIKKWITLLSTNRKACVILDAGKTTEFFDLERGNAQGDTISPFLFNLGYQILLFKLELSLQIAGTLSEVAEEANAVVEAGTGRATVVSRDPKVSAMADDCTLLVKLTAENLQTIVNELSYFERISGLGCNLDKTVMLPVGVTGQIEQNIKDIGLQIVEEITLLGANIKNTGTSYEENGKNILNKIRRQVNFWNRFSLSLPGRINIAKTFMYSQVSYLGCFLPMGEKCLGDISTEIERFVKGKLQIGRQRIYDPVEMGGLGLFKVNDFLASQSCAWVRRAVKLDELWKKELYLGSYGTIFNIRKKNYDKSKNPILHYIASSFEKFIFSFTSKNENFRNAYIYENPSLPFDLNNRNFLKKEFFSAEEFELHKKRIHALKVEDLLNLNNTTKTKEEFELSTRINISDIKFNKLRILASNAVRLYKKIASHELKSDTVENFCMRSRRGSKRYRKILESSNTISISNNISKLSGILDQVINLEKSVRLNTVWTQNFLNNDTRTFLFKFHQNLLGLNTRVAHFVRNHPRTCTFCSLNQDPDDNPETLSHLFFDCEHVERILVPFFTWIFNSNNVRYISRQEYFQGFSTDCSNKNKVLDLVLIIFKKYIWDCKLRFTLPNLAGLKNHFISVYTNICSISRKVRDFTDKSAIFENNAEIRF